MWIRSQDKYKLVNVNHLNIKTAGYGNSDIFGREQILQECWTLGTYTDKRALEILNNIQEHILANSDKYIHLVYEMPPRII